MKVAISMILFSCFFIGSIPLAEAQMKITAFDQNGTLTWTNTLSNAVGAIQWSPSLTGGKWNSDWRSLSRIPITNETTTVSVPMKNWGRTIC
ncbi:hypothetical protein P4E94_18000 [Pontiellaceae bacterium B12219]|nr:hypothetical protein [Pontiellaceae bacterium B12219]